MNPYTFMQQGNHSFSRGDYGSALSFYLKALEGVRKDPDPLADLYGNIGNVYGIIGEVDEAVGYYKKAMEILRRIEDYARLGVTYVNVGNLYTDHGNPERGIHYYKQGALLLEQSEKWEALTVLYGNLSLVLLQKSEHQTALEYAEKGMTLAKRLNRPKLTADALHRLAKAKEGVGEIEAAGRLSEAAYSVYHQIGDEMGRAATLYHQVSLHEMEGNLKAAIRCLKEVIAIDEKYMLPKLNENKMWLKRLQAGKEFHGA
ncbi:MAG: tetratricopeptide repeat protein [Nitrospiria bacterium]